MTALPQIEPITERSLTPNVIGFLHRPVGALRDALVLTHGAGSNCQTPLLQALAEAFAGEGFLVLRCDLPFRQSSPHGPPPPGNAERDREGLRSAVAAVSKLVPGKVFLGGHSYGGRQASMLAAAAPELVAGLLLLSYPLHPPRKPQQLRVQHFPDLQTPALFVHGTRDPFGTEKELTKALKLIPARTELLLIAGAGHDLKTGKKVDTETHQALAVRVLERFANFFAKL
jgi:predicted alpha/beta-hydrolase family hydrolase